MSLIRNGIVSLAIAAGSNGCSREREVRVREDTPAVSRGIGQPPVRAPSRTSTEDEPDRNETHHYSDSDERAFQLAILVRALHVMPQQRRGCIEDQIRELWARSCGAGKSEPFDLAMFDSLKGLDCVGIRCERAFLSSGRTLTRSGREWIEEK
jgi:hypothetical protein